MSESTLLKPIVMGAVIIGIDKMYMQNENMTESVYFGIAGAAGAYFGAAAAKAMPLPLPSGEYFDGKTVEMRIAEIGIGAGVGYGLNMFSLIKLSELTIYSMTKKQKAIKEITIIVETGKFSVEF